MQIIVIFYNGDSMKDYYMMDVDKIFKELNLQIIQN